MSIFLSAFFGSMVGQAVCLWIIGTLANRQEAAKAQAIQQAIFEAHEEAQKQEKKMREYVRLES